MLVEVVQRLLVATGKPSVVDGCLGSLTLAGSRRQATGIHGNWEQALLFKLGGVVQTRCHTWLVDISLRVLGNLTINLLDLAVIQPTGLDVSVTGG